MSPRRVWSMVLRYWYLLRRSVPRQLDLFYGPAVNIVLWGFVSQSLAHNGGGVAKVGAALIAGMLLWDVMFRAQLGVAVGFLEEVWARHLGHMFVSPLRAHEWLASLMIVSIFRTIAGLAPAVLIAMFMYRFSLFDLGLPLAGFIANLMIMGWWLALVIVAAIFRFGQGAENLAWAAVFVMSPISAIYYPVSVLPVWLQPIALALPASHVFEGMRGVLIDHAFHPRMMLAAAALNLVYVLLASAIFLLAFRGARKRGSILQLGE